MEKIDARKALDWADHYWQVQGKIKPLPSYQDINFRITGECGDYVLKIAHPSSPVQALDFENRAMLYLAGQPSPFNWPQAIASTREDKYLLQLSHAGQTYAVRLLTFIPGGVYAHTITTLPTADQAILEKSLGQAVATLTRQLSGFEHPGAAIDHPWNLMLLPRLESAMVHLDTVWRQRTNTFLTQLKPRLAQWKHTLPQQIIHNDANDYNVLVKAGQPQEVASIIDFGDMCRSFRIANLAIALAYAMPHAQDPVTCAHRVISGYLEQESVRPEEWEALPLLVQARACQSILMAASHPQKAPDNAYIDVSQQGMHRLWNTFEQLSPDALIHPFQH